MKSDAGRKTMSRRGVLKLLAGGTLLGLADGLWIEPDMLTVTRSDVFSEKLPPEFDGLRIALLADFHFRPGKDDWLLQKVIEQTRTEKPGLIALVGDYMSGEADVLMPLLDGLRDLEAAHGVFAVMGNHDGWASDRAAVRRRFEKAGISFLINQHSLVSIKGRPLAVAGTDFVWLGKPDAKAMLSGVAAETPVLALVHEPDYFDEVIAQRDVLQQVSGHSHGGQCRVPLLGLAPITPKYAKNYIYGNYQRGGSNLFVTRGVGTTGPRIRFSCPPELAMLTLRRKVTAA